MTPSSYLRSFLARAPLAALALSATMLHAQSSSGAISITVFDAGGAAVAGATVTVTGSDTGAQLRTLQTNDKGIAEIPLVPPGNYNVVIAAPGFKTLQQKSINVQVGATVTLQPSLQLG